MLTAMATAKKTVFESLPISIAITSIRSFNADKPFDQFLVEQLAGDELV